jgi:ATP-dependent helicase IRC3
MTALKLRQYQEDCLTSIHEHHAKGVSRQLVHMATGAGKTVVFANLIAQKNCKTLVLAHTRELLAQAKEKIEMVYPGSNIGVVQEGQKGFNHDIVIASIQSASRKETLEQLKRESFKLCIYDEAHRSASDSARRVLTELGFLGNSPSMLLVGFTATPFRNGPKGLSKVFEKVVFSKSVKDLISSGYLCKPIGVKIKTDLDLSTVETENGDFKTESLASYMDTPEITQLIIEAYIERARNRKTVAFCTNVSHARNLAAAFKRQGIASEAIHGGTPTSERLGILERFNCGYIEVLTNCQILTEGWDSPAVDCILMAKPTQSKGLYQQMAGRGLRLYPKKKDCLILDFGSKSHTLCGTAALLDDVEETKKKAHKVNKTSEFVQKLPPTINKKLKVAILNFDPIGEEFIWAQEGQTFHLKGAGNMLKIFPVSVGRFNVALIEGKNSYQTLAENLTFDYAFSAAEEFAKANRGLFSVSDLDAPWRALPISDKQQSFFRSFGYRAGIEDLSRGQAALIIGSGVLNKKTAQTLM